MDLSTIHGPNYLVISAKAWQEFLSAIQEAMNMVFSIPAERRYVTQLAMKFHHYGVSYPPFDCLRYAHFTLKLTLSKLLLGFKFNPG